MGRMSISVPDDVVAAAKVAELDAYLVELEGQLGPIPVADLAEAERWADRVLGPDHSASSAEDDQRSA